MLFVCDILLIAWLGYAKLYLDKDPRHWLTQFLMAPHLRHHALFLLYRYRAYLDGASLERYEVPYFGQLAAEWVDSE